VVAPHPPFASGRVALELLGSNLFPDSPLAVRDVLFGVTVEVDLLRLSFGALRLGVTRSHLLKDGELTFKLRDASVGIVDLPLRILPLLAHLPLVAADSG
jgi:hypothetical protein